MHPAVQFALVTFCFLLALLAFAGIAFNIADAPDRALERLWCWITRHETLVGALIAGTMTLGGGFLAYWAATTDTRTRERVRAQKSLQEEHAALKKLLIGVEIWKTYSEEYINNFNILNLITSVRGDINENAIRFILRAKEEMPEPPRVTVNFLTYFRPTQREIIANQQRQIEELRKHFVIFKRRTENIVDSFQYTDSPAHREIRDRAKAISTIMGAVLRISRMLESQIQSRINEVEQNPLFTI